MVDDAVDKGGESTLVAEFAGFDGLKDVVELRVQLLSTVSGNVSCKGACESTR